MPNDDRRCEEFVPLSQRMAAQGDARRAMLDRLADVRRDAAPAVVVPNVGMTMRTAAEAMRTMTTAMQQMRYDFTYTTSAFPLPIDAEAVAQQVRIDQERQRAMQRQRLAQLELQQVRDLERQLAWAHDDEVLREHLSDTQRHWLDDHGCFVAVSSLGRKFKITNRGASGNVILLSSRGRELLSLCAHVRENLSQAGHMLTQKLCLETSEPAFTAVANVYGVLDHAEYNTARQYPAHTPGMVCQCGCGAFLRNITDLVNILVPV